MYIKPTFLHKKRRLPAFYHFVLLTNAANCILLSKNKRVTSIFKYFCSEWNEAYFCYKNPTKKAVTRLGFPPLHSTLAALLLLSPIAHRQYPVFTPGRPLSVLQVLPFRGGFRRGFYFRKGLGVGFYFREGFRRG